MSLQIIIHISFNITLSLKNSFFLYKVGIIDREVDFWPFENSGTVIVYMYVYVIWLIIY